MQSFKLAAVCVAVVVAAYVAVGISGFARTPAIFGLVIIAAASLVFSSLKRWLGMTDAVIVFVVFAILASSVGVFSMLSVRSGLGMWERAGAAGVLVYPAFGILVIAAYSAASAVIASFAARVFSAALLAAVFSISLGRAPEKLAGMIVMAVIGIAFLELLMQRRKPLLPVPVQVVSGAVVVIGFLTASAGFAGNPEPLAAGVVSLLILGAFSVRYFYQFDDMIVLVDEDNKAIGISPKLAAHHSDTQLHRAFSVFIFDRDGRLLLQRRAAGKKTWPGVWSNSCCGHVMLNESVMAAASRRLRFELGLTKIRLFPVLRDFRYRAELNGIVENEICPVLVGFTDREPVRNPDEVGDVRWVEWNKFVSEVAMPSSGYSPWAIEEVSQLAASEAFAELYNLHTRAVHAGGIAAEPKVLDSAA